MITGKDFVFTGLQPWDIPIGSNARDIALEVSKHNRVLYVNTPLDKKTYKSKSEAPDIVHRQDTVDGKALHLRQINPNLWILDYPFTVWPINFLPDGKLFDLANKANNIKMYSFVKKILRQLNFNEYILFIDNDIYRSFYAIDLLQPVLSIYYRRDNLTSAYWRKHAPRLEPLLCEKCDLVATNSSQLAEAVSTYNPNTDTIGQGLDLSKYDHKANYALPPDMINIPRPIIGYVGWITDRRLDANLIYEVAKQCPSYSFVMVGGEDEYFKVHKLHTLKNVIFLGEKPQASIPSYVAHFDVCMNPQKINHITIGNYPRKIDEYLALGKPVIATRTKTMSLFEDHVWNCDDTTEYVEAIHTALQTNNQTLIKKRIQFAHMHTWENSVNKLYSFINL